jgi:hypothetical protein
MSKSTISPANEMKVSVLGEWLSALVSVQDFGQKAVMSSTCANDAMQWYYAIQSSTRC